MSDLLAELTQGSIHVVYSFGYVGVFVLVALSNLLFPIPSQLVLAFSGFLIGRGYFSFPPVLLASTAASVISALVLYAPGHRLGEKPLHRFVRRLGWLTFVNESHLDRASAWFEQHDEKAILIARLVPGVGSLISVPAGLNRMPLWRFLTYTTLGAILWNTTFIVLGWALGTGWRMVAQYAQPLGYVGLAILVSGVLWFLWHRRRTHR
jgi:membrane protein DedA with SNARE-associated domain